MQLVGRRARSEHSPRRAEVRQRILKEENKQTHAFKALTSQQGRRPRPPSAARRLNTNTSSSGREERRLGDTGKESRGPSQESGAEALHGRSRGGCSVLLDTF
ncbi:hypothetical protein NDU88_003698 [Pleurodeles waltl]|uniref:Uncharacterized protein n=1 Tax=Pleurodeles waltl TaxID=8319 RepID=A0AAV7QGC2_PLEWA|nr:hypothetical protein NDU88_003698 [Pleurodeles waltl]